MGEILVYPLLELLFLLLFCSKMARRRPSLPGIVCASVCAVLYIALRRHYIGNFDALILVFRIFYLLAFCRMLFDVPMQSAGFLCACLSLLLHAVILFYYNLPFLSHLTKQWPLADALMINLLRGSIVLCLRKTAAEAAHARIEPIELLLVLVSYLGYIVDISSYISVISVKASTLEASVVLFMYCLATILSVSPRSGTSSPEPGRPPRSTCRACSSSSTPCGTRRRSATRPSPACITTCATRSA